MPELDYRAISRRAQADLKRQKAIARWVFFAVSLAIYVMFVTLGWALYTDSVTELGAAGRDLDPTGMIMLTVGGGLGVMFQFFSAILDTRAGEARMRARTIERLVADEIMRLGEDGEDLTEEKAKRMSISDEGELEEMSEEEIAAFEARRSQSGQ